MLKLMKYEFRKQMFSKLVMLIILGLLMVWFLFSNYTDNKDAAEVSMMLMGATMILSVFYVAIECLMVYEKDLSTRQSYMLFLVPQSSKSILGAKMLAAILQILLTLVMFAGVIGVSVFLYLAKYEGMQAIFDAIKEFIESLLQVEIDALYILDRFCSLAVLWVFVVMTGIFVTTAINTVLNRSKLASFLAIILYFVCFYLVGKLEGVILDLNWSETAANIFSYVYMIGFDLLFFFGTAWLMDKKLSV